jgi:Rho-binding antiterminator
MHRRECVVEFTGEDQATTQLTSIIVDVFSRDGEEFMRLASGEEIRLDRLISVAGKKLRDFC